jgi:hypothetical protein
MSETDDLPVLLVAWRRPTLTAEVVAALRINRPSVLYVALDGPRPHAPGDRALIARTRRVIEGGIDWDCDVSWRQRSANSGSGAAVTDAVDWFFDAVPAGVVLEDDCVPHPDLIPFASAVLHRYRHDDRVMSVSAENPCDVRPTGGASYAFVRWPRPWGWATRRDSWRRMQGIEAAWRTARRSGLLRSLIPRADERRLWTAILEAVSAGHVDSWHYRWTAAHLLNGGLSALPTRNLVTNIGFGASAEHTFDPTDPRAEHPTGALGPLVHPAEVALDETADRAVLDATENAEHVRRYFQRRPRGRLMRRSRLS